MNSIKLVEVIDLKGQPAGTNKEKNSNPSLLSPNIVAPRTTVKLKEKVNIKWLKQSYKVSYQLNYLLV